MKVIVKIKSLEGEIITGFLDVGVRKCPPNYNTQKGEYVVELEDYTENDIKEYFEKPQIWGRRHEDPEKEQYISLMRNEDENI